MEKVKTLTDFTLYLGCDPEFFFSKKGEVFGAEKVLPKDGLVYDKAKTQAEGRFVRDNSEKREGETSKIVIDGVQAEINPRQATCREYLSYEIASCFRELYHTIKDDKTLDVNFSAVMEVGQKEFDSLSDKSKKFGCAPSENIHTGGKSKISVDPTVYKFRSAGGHIHLGHYKYGSWSNDGKSFSAVEFNKILMEGFNPKKLVPLLDILLGNTCVLIDRNEFAVERRKVYGRAGEYRTPKHGLEYRTLSNFWLINYQMMSFVFGMARFAYIISVNDLVYPEKKYGKYILSLVDQEDVIEAINNNDFDLAYKNFKKVEDVIVELAGVNCNGRYPLNATTIKQFHHFVKKGIKYWFKDDPMKHWLAHPNGSTVGWERFACGIVNIDMNKKV